MSLASTVLESLQTADKFGLTAGSIYAGFWDILGSLLSRPIGLANPWGVSQAMMRATLEQNIGNTSAKNRERYVTPIGTLANPYYNLDKQSFAKLDTVRRDYYDYIDYMTDVFYDGRKNIPGEISRSGVRPFSAGMLDLDNAKVGVIRNLNTLDFGEPTSINTYTQSDINPNNYGESGLDTRSGIISNYYLTETLKASVQNQEKLGYSYTQRAKDDMTTGDDVMKSETGKVMGDAAITKGVYSNFGLTRGVDPDTNQPYGDFGLLGHSFIDDSSTLEYGSYAKPNVAITGQIIPWSTADHFYDSLDVYDDLSRVNKLQDSVTEGDQRLVTLYFKDSVQETDLSHYYVPFGNYYSLTYSLGMIGHSGGMTQNYIAYSMLGYPLTKVKTDQANGANKKLSITELLTNENIHGSVYKQTKDKDGNTITVWEPYPRKYYVTNGSQGTNYLDQMTGCKHSYTKFGGNYNSSIVRVNIIDPGNDNMWTSRAIFEHIEAEGKVPGSPLLSRADTRTANYGIAFGRYKIYDPDVIGTRPDIIFKTNRLFSTNNIKTIIGRFHTDSDSSTLLGALARTDPTASAQSQYGMSRGRNLLRRNHGVGTNKTAGNGYDNPYCRVWTYHHQYATLEDTIRPFKQSLVNTGVQMFRTKGSYGFEDGQSRLEKLGVRNPTNRLVSIAPTKNGSVKNQMKKVMFSIENLAWKGFTDDLSEEQTGPLGGRIMWFPPYNLSFSESTTVNWEKTTFIGRGEPIPTYSNTERTGNLTFDLLIDHPSVLDRYAGVDVGGRGIGNPDDTESYEQMLLRFFAGCEVMSNKYAPKPTSSDKEDLRQEERDLEVQRTPKNEKCILMFNVFFPNNYTGANDTEPERVKFSNDREAEIPYPIAYLLAGKGTGLLFDSNKAQSDKDRTKVHRGTIVFADGSSSRVGKTNVSSGYEMMPNIGLNTLMSSDDKIMEDCATNPALFENNGSKYNNAWYYHACYEYRNTEKDKKLWGYRIDFDRSSASPNKWYKNQNLGASKEYSDYTSYQLNSKGYHSATSMITLPEDLDPNGFVSFVDAFLGMEYDDENVSNDYLHLKEYASVENIKFVQQIKEVLKKYKNKRVEVSGYASPNGYDKDNKQLSKDRYTTLKTWMEKFDFMSGATFKEGEIRVLGSKKGANNDMPIKIGRSATVCVYVTIEDIESNINIADNYTDMKLKGQNPPQPNEGGNAGGTETGGTQTQSIMSRNGGIMPLMDGGSDDKQDPPNDNPETPKPTEPTPPPGFDFTPTLNTTVTVPPPGSEGLKLVSVEDLAKTTEKEEDDRLKDQAKENKGYKQSKKQSLNATENDSEHVYFEQLKQKDPFLHSKLVEKIRYFDPAFHSLSPEGYQARLTFLQQCTRQGNTISNSDTSGGATTASNLSFGRPPILVLRIGDFYNTRIIVNSLNIDFKNSSGLQWDMNDEGIGVMPMYASIQMSITFLGGSDLGGPIARLQNAMSFNYYANTSVYDDRAERIEYSGDGSGNYTKFAPYR